MMSGTRSVRGEQTRELIVTTALRLLRERGYDATTMRAVATEAGVSVGNAYYYFGSKEHLIQAFYDELGEQHRALAEPRIAQHSDLAGRLRAALLASLDVMVPYRTFAGGFFKTAADPQSPLSPFSADSGPARDRAIAFYAAVLDGSDAKVAAALRPELPRLFWLFQMGIVLYWVHDRSEGARHSYQLVERSVPLVVRLIGLSRLPILRGLTDDVLALLRIVGPDGVELDGIDPDGIDPDGIDPDGIDPDGIDPDGIDPDGIDPDGIDTASNRASGGVEG
jgi:AcrR family transcriptional regulator